MNRKQIIAQFEKALERLSDFNDQNWIYEDTQNFNFYPLYFFDKNGKIGLKFKVKVSNDA